MIPEYLITLTAPPALEESIVDWLLQFGSQAGFTSYTVYGHSSREADLTLAEQVAGRKKQIRFQMHIHPNRLPDLIDKLQREFQGAGLHYWVSPLIESGHI